jgi:hypothetical protein
MVRSLAIALMVASLGWTGLAWAQSSEDTASRPRFITVREEGKSPQRCQIIKSWREPNGAPVFQVRAVDTGEVMTIVGSAPSASTGDPRAMTTRIYRWNGDNKPPAGAPQAPKETASLPRQTPTPLNPARNPQSTPIPTTARAPEPPALSPVTQPSATAKPTASTFTSQQSPVGSFDSSTPSTTPTTPKITSQPKPVAPGTLPSYTPMGTQIIAQKTPGTLPPLPTPSTSVQPRLSPTPNGTPVVQKPCDCTSSAPCETNCKPCETCNQSTVCCPPSPMRQPFIGRLFKSKRECDCKEIVCESPTAKPAAPKAAPAPAHTTVPTSTPIARDARESWGKVEPWQTKPTETVAKRADPVPVQMEKTHPDPIQNPELFRNIAMNSHPKNSNIVESNPVVAAPQKREIVKPTEQPADEGNAFWTPAKPTAPTAETAQVNAFDRTSNTPPSNYPNRIAPTPRLPVPPPGPTPRLPVPPPGPVPMPPAPMQPARLDVGVPDAMGNAFTIAGTRRPIPADFGGAPQVPNAFADSSTLIEGEGTPPRGYSTVPAMPNNMARQPMPNALAMMPMPAGANPLMTVPPSPVAHVQPAASQPTGVPQLLATLKESLRPSEREQAAEQLSELNWKLQPMVVEHLIKSAQDDPAASVRAACVHALAQMKANSMEVAAIVQKLKSDRDSSVRHEAEEACVTLGFSTTPSAGSAIQPASNR